MTYILSREFSSNIFFFLLFFKLPLPLGLRRRKLWVQGDLYEVTSTLYSVPRTHGIRRRFFDHRGIFLQANPTFRVEPSAEADGTLEWTRNGHGLHV